MSEHKIGFTEMKSMVDLLHASKEWKHDSICWGSISTFNPAQMEETPVVITLMLNGVEHTVFRATSEVLFCYRDGRWIDAFWFIYQEEKTKHDRRTERANQEKLAIEFCNFLPIQDGHFPDDKSDKEGTAS